MALENTPKPQPFTMSEMSFSSKPNRRSGLSEPKRSMASRQGIRRKGVWTSTSSTSLNTRFREALLDGLDLLLVQEGHLQVDLGELRLPVGPEVLVPEAPGDLEVPVKPCQHQQLLVLLGDWGRA